MHHAMSPTGVAVLLLFALVVDYLSIGPNSIRDRLAFFMGLAAIQQGFDGSPLDLWTVGFLSSLLDQAKGLTGAAYIAGATTTVLLGAGIDILAIYAVGAVLPNKATKWMGRLAAIKFPSSGLHRLNYKLWLIAVVLGMLADLARGGFGTIVHTVINLDVTLCASIPFRFFGVN